jgi:aminoglycoside phosphotransferase family enzyme
MSFERIWGIAAGGLLLAAAVLLWRNNHTGAFVTAALGVVAWFLSYRSQVRAKVAAETKTETIDELDEN